MAVAEVDYQDTFTVERAAGDDRTAEQWARAALEDAPAALRWFVVVGWRFVLLLRLDPRPSADSVLGWRIVHQQPEEATIEAVSPLMTARLRFQLEDDRLVWTTLIWFTRRRLASVVWPPVSLLHRRIVPYVLSRAGRQQVRPGRSG